MLKIISTFLLLLCITVKVNAQGCSDAGFCTIGNLSQHSVTKTEQQKFSVFLPVGIGDENVFVFTPAIQYDNQLSKNWALQAKLSGNYASGNLGTATGAGDLFLAGTYIFPADKSDWNLSLSLGTKLPLNQSNLKEGGLSLPMQYQSSLGTVDIITGLALGNKNWQFAAGWQQPLSGANENMFLPVLWNNADAAKYPPSRAFNRKGDLLLRGFYKYAANEKFRLNAGLLGIYHLAEDSYTNLANQNVSIKGSDGLTLNASITALYALNKRVNLGLTAAAPLIVRDVRPDGLTRSFVLAPEISWNF